MPRKISDKVMNYVRSRPNRTISASTVRKHSGGSSGGVVNALRIWGQVEPKLEFVKVGAGRNIHVRYNDAALLPLQGAPKSSAQTPKGEIGVGLTLTMEEGQPPVTLSEQSARKLYQTLKRMFGNESS